MSSCGKDQQPLLSISLVTEIPANVSTAVSTESSVFNAANSSVESGLSTSGMTGLQNKRLLTLHKQILTPIQSNSNLTSKTINGIECQICKKVNSKNN